VGVPIDGRTAEALVCSGIRLAGISDRDPLLSTFLSEAGRLTGSAAGVAYVHEADELRVGAWQNDVLRDTGHVGQLVLPRGQGVPVPEAHPARVAADERRVLLGRGGPDTPLCEPWGEHPEYRTVRYLCAPLVGPNDTVVGSLLLADPRGPDGAAREFSPEMAEAVSLLAAQAAAALHNAQRHDRLVETVDHLIDVGIALTSVRNLDSLLQLIVSEARTLAQCDGGSVFVRERDQLKLAVWQNETLRKRGGLGGEVVPLRRSISVGPESIAGHVAATSQVLNLPDAYDLKPDAAYRLDGSWDVENDYRTQSLLCAPMTSPEGETVGVLQLINALASDGSVQAFPAEIESPTRALASQAAVAIRNAQLHGQLKDSYFDTIVHLAHAAEFRDLDTAIHLVRMSVYAWIIALNLGLSDERAELIRFAAPMHDIGKLGVRDAVLLKPGRLDPDERAEMERHAEMGAEILAGSQAEVIQTSSLIALTHHEKWDGTGYPRRLKCDDTAIEGRIVGLADAFDCISSRRVYKEATPFDEAVEVVKRDSGTHFDPACVGAFVRGGDAVRATYDSMNDEASLDLSALSLRELLHSPGSSSG